MPRSHKYKEPTIEAIRAAALECQTRTEFSKKSPSLYRYAWSKGLLDDVCSHIADARKIWTLEMLQEEASKYTSRSAFQKGSSAAYQAARYQGVLSILLKIAIPI